MEYRKKGGFLCQEKGIEAARRTLLIVTASTHIHESILMQIASTHVIYIHCMTLLSKFLMIKFFTLEPFSDLLLYLQQKLLMVFSLRVEHHLRGCKVIWNSSMMK